MEAIRRGAHGRDERGWLCKMFVVFALMALSGLACGHSARPEMDALDRSGYNYNMGLREMERGQEQAAIRQFREGIGVNPKDPSNYEMLGILLARNGEEQRALDTLATARKLSHSDLSSIIATGRAYTELQRTREAIQWLHRAERKWPESPELKRWLAVAYEKAGRYGEADVAFEASLRIAPNPEVEREWKAHQQQRRATNLTNIAEGLSDRPTVTRAQAAALFLVELDLERLMPTRGSYLNPGQLMSGPPPYVVQERRAEAGTAPDVTEHWAREAIEQVVAMGIMKLNASGYFESERPVRRVELAHMTRRLMALAAGNDEIGNISENMISPLEDVSSYSPDFGAVMLASSHGVLCPRSPGHFEPSEPVAGAEMILAIHALRETLSSLKGGSR